MIFSKLTSTIQNVSEAYLQREIVKRLFSTKHGILRGADMFQFFKYLFQLCRYILVFKHLF